MSPYKYILYMDPPLHFSTSDADLSRLPVYKLLFCMLHIKVVTMTGLTCTLIAITDMNYHAFVLLDAGLLYLYYLQYKYN